MYKPLNSQATDLFKLIVKVVQLNTRLSTLSDIYSLSPKLQGNVCILIIMLRLYVDTLIVGHKHCNVLSLLTEIELQR